jgi:hypothetical protein
VWVDVRVIISDFHLVFIILTPSPFGFLGV